MECPHCKKHINYYYDIVIPEAEKRYNSNPEFTDEEIKELKQYLYKSAFQTK
jgi:hypothetical protein